MLHSSAGFWGTSIESERQGATQGQETSVENCQTRLVCSGWKKPNDLVQPFEGFEGGGGLAQNKGYIYSLTGNLFGIVWIWLDPGPFGGSVSTKLRFHRFSNTIFCSQVSMGKSSYPLLGAVWIMQVFRSGRCSIQTKGVVVRHGSKPTCARFCSDIYRLWKLYLM